jgi:hypothetical protein
LKRIAGEIKKAGGAIQKTTNFLLSAIAAGTADYKIMHTVNFSEPLFYLYQAGLFVVGTAASYLSLRKKEAALAMPTWLCILDGVAIWLHQGANALPQFYPWREKTFKGLEFKLGPLKINFGDLGREIDKPSLLGLPQGYIWSGILGGSYLLIQGIRYLRKKRKKGGLEQKLAQD